MNFIYSDENAIYYECGYSCDNALYLSLGSESFFITDSRYTTDANEYVKYAQVVIGKDLYAQALALLVKHKIKSIYFDPKTFSVFGFNKLSNSKIEFIALPDMSHKKRVIKSAKEIELLSKAVKLGKKAFSNFARYINEEGLGKRESYLAYQAQANLSDFGSYDLSFEPIVALNENAAKPHAHPTQKRAKEGDLLLVDAGLKYERYCSDRTRTVQLGDGFTFKRKQTFSNKKRQKVYDTVLKAHDKAIEKARSGMKASRVDALCREVIEKAGYGRYFVHSTGHGVGLDIHEMPYISSKSDTIIEDGMVYTIEPGIYLPNEFGVRIEDMVVMQEGRASIL